VDPFAAQDCAHVSLKRIWKVRLEAYRDAPIRDRGFEMLGQLDSGYEKNRDSCCSHVVSQCAAQRQWQVVGSPVIDDNETRLAVDGGLIAFAFAAHRRNRKARECKPTPVHLARVIVFRDDQHEPSSWLERCERHDKRPPHAWKRNRPERKSSMGTKVLPYIRRALHQLRTSNQISREQRAGRRERYTNGVSVCARPYAPGANGASRSGERLLRVPRSWQACARHTRHSHGGEALTSR
jgi:hypothetical protein